MCPSCVLGVFICHKHITQAEYHDRNVLLCLNFVDQVSALPPVELLFVDLWLIEELPGVSLDARWDLSLCVRRVQKSIRLLGIL